MTFLMNSFWNFDAMVGFDRMTSDLEQSSVQSTMCTYILNSE